MTHDSTPRAAFCFGDDYIVPSPAPPTAERTRHTVKETVFERRFEGLANSVNGGYLAGVLSEGFGNDASTTRLMSPVPLDTPVYIFNDEDRVDLRHCDQTVATAQRGTGPISDTPFVPVDIIVAGQEPPWDRGIFADCFVCGRHSPEGLGIDPKLVGDDLVASIWEPARSIHVTSEKVPARILRTALDCPGGFAVIAKHRRLAVTGTMETKVYFEPDADQRLIVVGQPTFADGRRLGATTTIFTENDEVVASAETTWVAIDATSQAA